MEQGVLNKLSPEGRDDRIQLERYLFAHEKLVGIEKKYAEVEKSIQALYDELESLEEVDSEASPHIDAEILAADIKKIRGQIRRLEIDKIRFGGYVKLINGLKKPNSEWFAEEARCN